MKITKYLCLAFSIFLFSCGDDEAGDTGTGNEGAMSFTAAITAHQEKAASRLTTNNSWAGLTDNSIAVQIGDAVKKYTVSDAGAMTSDNPFYWNEMAAADVAVSAWYPYNDGKKPEVIVCANQSIAENFQKSDFLECEMTVTKENPVLVFTHAGAKIICEVVLDTSLDASLNASRVMLYGLSGVDEGTTVTTNGAREALVAPQTIKAGSVLVGIELSDGRYTEQSKEGALEEDLVIEKGHYYILQATVCASEMKLVCTGSSVWGGTSSDIDAENPSVGSGVEGDGWEQNGEETGVEGGTSTVAPGNGDSGSTWGGGSENVDAGTKEEQQ